MASFAAAKVLVNAGAVATVTGFVSTGLFYAGKKAVALETKHCDGAKSENSALETKYCEGAKSGNSVLETKYCERAKSGNSANYSSRRRSHGLSFAPQFDGLHCFETIVTKSTS